MKVAGGSESHVRSSPGRGLTRRSTHDLEPPPAEGAAGFDGQDVVAHEPRWGPWLPPEGTRPFPRSWASLGSIMRFRCGAADHAGVAQSASSTTFAISG